MINHVFFTFSAVQIYDIHKICYTERSVLFYCKKSLRINYVASVVSVRNDYY